MKCCTLLLCLLVLLGTSHASGRKPALPERFAKWLDEDVVYIITDDERKSFLTLTSDAERDRFISDFWEVRNPASGSSANSYKEEHYSRLEYANSHFGRESNTPGWMTDRGRTWILFGKPTSQHAFVGYSQIYPMELWFYSNAARNPALPSFFTVLFYMPGDIGEYKFYRPFLDGPLQLVRGSQFNSNADVYRALSPLGGDVARASLSLIPSTPVDTRNFQPDMSSDMLISKIENWANDHFNVEQLRAKRSVRTFVASRFLIDAKSLDVQTLVLTDSLGQHWLDYAAAIDDEQMGGKTSDGQFAVDLTYRLTTATGTVIYEDETQRKYPAYDSAQGFNPFEIAGRLPVVPGSYNLELRIVDAKTGHSYQGRQPVSVPAKAADASLSGPLIADSVSRAPQPNSVTPYQFFGYQFHPLFRAETVLRKPLRILYQVYEPQPADGQVEYVLANLVTHDARAVVDDRVEAAKFQNGSLLMSKTFDTSALPEGEYMLAIRLKSEAGVVSASLTQRLRIGAGAPEAPLYFAADPQRLATPGMADYLRGLCAMAQGDDEAAAQFLDRAWKRNPGNSFCKQFLVRAYYRSHHLQAVSDVYRQSSLKDFDVTPDVMAEIAVSLLETGNPTEASAVLKFATARYPDDAAIRTATRFLNPRN